MSTEGKQPGPSYGTASYSLCDAIGLPFLASAPPRAVAGGTQSQAVSAWLNEQGLQALSRGHQLGFRCPMVMRDRCLLGGSC